MIQDHANAFLALLRADSQLTVYPEVEPDPDSDEVVPAGALPPYVAVHIHMQRDVGPTLDMRSSRAVMRAYCHCVGGNDIAARAVAQRVAAAVLDVRPNVAGRNTFPIRHDQSVPPRPDKTTGALIVDQTDVYRLESVPGAAV